eukprot:SAG11_NODE_7666_length_1113_cov_1.006903_1_plen_30_part_10
MNSDKLKEHEARYEIQKHLENNPHLTEPRP